MSGTKLEVIKTAKKHKKILHCAYCKGAYSRSFFYRHKKECDQRAPKPIPPDLLGSGYGANPGFEELLKSFHDNDIGH